MAPQDREEEQAQGFVVSDKRLFTSDGERREGVERSEPVLDPSAELLHQEASPELPVEPAAAPAAPEAPPPPEVEPDSSASEIDFSTYLVMLANTVMMLLGQVPDPGTQQRHLDLPQAKHTIDILLMLREKTQGNLTAEEAKLLEDIMPQLQMAYTSISQQVGQ